MEELELAHRVQAQLSHYARMRFGIRAPVSASSSSSSSSSSSPSSTVPVAFALAQLAQLLQRYANGVTETIVHSETQVAFDEYRHLLGSSSSSSNGGNGGGSSSSSNRQRLALRDVLGGGRSTERDLGARSVLDVTIQSVATRPTLAMVPIMCTLTNMLISIFYSDESLDSMGKVDHFWC